jgi:tripartite-type tricarboxylate transporter receptor subunit TctC
MSALASVALSFACLLFCSVTVAQTPNKDPIRLVVGFAPGGPSDIAGRIAAEILSAKLGVSVVVENRAGASGSIAADAVANAKPDGNTLLVNVTADIVNPVINREPKNFITTRFAPVALIATAPNVLVVHPSLPVTSAKELVAFMRSQKADNSLSYASAGLGTVSHLSGVLFTSASGASLIHVPYNCRCASRFARRSCTDYV